MCERLATAYVQRRGCLARLAAVGSVALAGCLGDSGLDEEGVAVVDRWLLDAVDVVDEAELRVSFWFDEPSSVDVPALETLVTDAAALSSRWDEAVAPKLDRLSDTEIDRSVANETWLVDGDDLATELEALHAAVESVETGVGALVEADGDPDGVDDTARSQLADLAENARETVDSVLELWFRDTLGPGGG